MKIGLIQRNFVVGDLEGNASLIEAAVCEASSRGVDLAITSELALLGYPPRDLLLRENFVSRAWEVAERLGKNIADKPPTLLGLAEPNRQPDGRPLLNSAVFLEEGRIMHRFHKCLLPTYDVFDEDRYFEPACGPQVLGMSGQRLGISICEDIWNDRDYRQKRRYQIDPIRELKDAGAECIINLSASPFSAGKHALREQMLSGIARKYQVPIVYVNQIGGNDELIFDGRSCVFDSEGHLVARGGAFQEDLVIADLDAMTASEKLETETPEEEVWGALVLGTRDYVRKCGFGSVVVGLSGGIDSSLTAAIAAEAIGNDRTLGVLMPSPFSSGGSLEDSLELAANLGIETMTLPIHGIMNAFEDTLSVPFSGFPRDVTEENVQARIRGTLLMALSNKFGALLLTTGNKSELAVGYATLYGDMAGGLAVIADLTKTMVYKMAHWLNERHSRTVIPEAILNKAPSAELRPDQLDQDTLPPYDILDEILKRRVEFHMSRNEILSEGFDRPTVDRVLKLIRNSEFKRRQAAPGLKVTDRAFGAGWRMPIASRDHELDSL